MAEAPSVCAVPRGQGSAVAADQARGPVTRRVTGASRGPGLVPGAVGGAPRPGRHAQGGAQALIK